MSIQTTGAFGTQWSSRVMVFNEAPTAWEARFRPGSCPIPCSDRWLIPPGDGWLNLGSGDAADPGQIIYVQTDGVSSLRFTNSFAIVEKTSLARPAGHLPVLREDELPRSTVHFLDVSPFPSSRRLLRIYTLGPSMEFDVEVTEMFSNQRLQVAVVSTSAAGEYSPGFAQFGSFVELDDPRVTLRISVTPRSPSPFWSFVTVTDNRTQNVDVVLPE
jgi:hypothetical protein